MRSEGVGPTRRYGNIGEQTLLGVFSSPTSRRLVANSDSDPLPCASYQEACFIGPSHSLRSRLEKLFGPKSFSYSLLFSGFLLESMPSFSLQVRSCDALQVNLILWNGSSPGFRERNCRGSSSLILSQQASHRTERASSGFTSPLTSNANLACQSSQSKGCPNNGFPVSPFLALLNVIQGLVRILSFLMMRTAFQ